MNTADDHLKVVLAEYQEVCTYHRHEDSIKWTIVTLTFTGAAASIAWTAVSLPYAVCLALLLASGLVWVGKRAYCQLQAASKIRLSRAHEIENELGMSNHTRIAEHDERAGYTGELTYPGGLAETLARAADLVVWGLFGLGMCGIVITPIWAVMVAVVPACR